MLKIIKIIILIYITFCTTEFVTADYTLDNGSKELANTYNISHKNLGDKISRKEFVEILYDLYIVYKKDRGVTIDYSSYSQLDNSKIFTDVKLDGDFGKKLSYFAHVGAFSKNEIFNGEGKVSQKDYFTIMKRLRIMYSLQQCKILKICEKELDEKFLFTKGTYLKYWSKILDKSLRKYYTNAEQYIAEGYKPLLSPSYSFPLRKQTLNGCYAFSIRNVTKYKHGIGIRIPAIEEYMEKDGTTLWNAHLMDKFDEIAHVKRKKFKNIDTLISSLQVGEPVSISYILEYYSYTDKRNKNVLHIVSAYSFDEKGVWVSETVTGRRLRISWDKIFNMYGNTKNNSIFRYDYQPMSTWTEEELALEQKHDFLVGEY